MEDPIARALSLLEEWEKSEKPPAGPVAGILRRRLEGIRINREGFLEIDGIQYQRWLVEACRKPGGEEYGYSRRGDFVRQFNLFGEKLYRAKWVREPLRVHNYRRKKPQATVDQEHLAILPLSSCLRLLARFRYELGDPEADPLVRQNPPWVAFCRAAFSLIAFGGLAWPGCFSDVASLRWKDVSTVVRGFIRLPRAGGWQRIFVEPVVAICVLALGIQLARLGGKRTPDPETSLLILPDGKLPIKGEVKEKIPLARRRFNAWLAGLCERAGVKPVTLSALAGVARARLQAMAGNVITGFVLGQTLYNPCPDDQFEALAAYRSGWGTWDFPSAGSSSAEETPLEYTKPEMGKGARHRAFMPDYSGSTGLERLLKELRDACRPFLRDSPPSRKEAGNLLLSLAARLLGVLEQAFSLEELAPVLKEQAANPSLGEGEAARLGVAMLALWLRHLILERSSPAATVASYRSAGENLLRSLLPSLPNEWDEEDVREILGLDYAESTKGHLLAAWKGWAAFLREKLGLEVARIDWGSFRRSAKIEPVRVITWPDFEGLLAVMGEEIMAAQNRGDVEKATRWQDAFDAAVLMYFFGLRIGEVVRLRIEDMVLRGVRPYLRVWRSKRGKSRLVYAHHVPGKVLEYLIHRRGLRWLAEGKDYRAPFLSAGKVEEACKKVLERTLMEAFGKAGLSGGEGRQVTVHSLRHAFANRLMVLGVPLLDISRAMGHSSPDTTIRSYIHCGDFLHREKVRHFIDKGEWGTQPMGFSYAGLGALMGLGRTGAIEAVRRFVRETGEEIEAIPRREWPYGGAKVPGRLKPWRPDQLLLPDSCVVKLLAWRLGETSVLGASVE